MHQQRHYVISIAGFDPSAGAGILADIKTFEQLGVYGLAVCSANTMQTENQFYSVKWISSADIIRQLNLLLDKYSVAFIKIGIVENLTVLHKILMYLNKFYPEIKIIWDPVLKASAGFVFHPEANKKRFMDCCRRVFLITPNTQEIIEWMQDMDAVAAVESLRSFSNVFMKSYLNQDGKLFDVLFTRNEIRSFESTRLYGFEKHGSGCVLSAAITSFLASGNDLVSSCELGKAYTFEFLQSETGLLGTHHLKNQPVSHA